MNEFAGTVRTALGRAATSRWRIFLLVLTGLLGVATAGLLVAGSSSDPALADVAAAVQLIMSVFVPFVGVLLASDLARAGRAQPLLPTLCAAALVGAATAAFGVLVCVATVAVAPDAPDAWANAPTVVLGSFLVQIVAALVGTGLGLLLRPPVVAMAGTIVLPLGLWFLLGTADGLRAAQQWLTPFASVQHLLGGEMTGPAWAQWFVVLLLWGVGLNAAGAWRLRRRRALTETW
jgi:hypothetical protein